MTKVPDYNNKPLLPIIRYPEDHDSNEQATGRQLELIKKLHKKFGIKYNAEKMLILNKLEAADMIDQLLKRK